MNKIIRKLKYETRYLGKDIKNFINKLLLIPTTKRNLFMERLGLKRHQYGTNFCYGIDKRRKQWRRERQLFGFDNRETWNLNHLFIEWLYSHLIMFNKVNIIDTSYYKFEWQGKEITHQEAIDLIVKACKKYLKDVDEEHPEYFQEVCDLMPLWGMILPHMWW